MTGNKNNKKKTQERAPAEQGDTQEGNRRQLKHYMYHLLFLNSRTHILLGHIDALKLTESLQ
jgi:hypothetical protein